MVLEEIIYMPTKAELFQFLYIYPHNGLQATIKMNEPHIHIGDTVEFLTYCIVTGETAK